MLLVAVGCGHNIGDPCTTNEDCDPLGTRFCDTASVNGYCTEEDCSATSCPGGSRCVRFFTALQDQPCLVSPPDMANMSSAVDMGNVVTCSFDDRCLCDLTVDNVCVGNAGHCAPNASEHRWCMKTCSHNSDCRNAYQCRETGTFGAEGTPTFDMGDPAVKFCAPTGISN